jgi:hypothetical protein
MAVFSPQNILLAEETRPLRFLVIQRIVTFVGAGFLMLMPRLMDQQVPIKSKIYNNLRHPNLPILENIQHLAIKQ